MRWENYFCSSSSLLSCDFVIWCCLEFLSFFNLYTYLCRILCFSQRNFSFSLVFVSLKGAFRWDWNGGRRGSARNGSFFDRQGTKDGEGRPIWLCPASCHSPHSHFLCLQTKTLWQPVGKKWGKMERRRQSSTGRAAMGKREIANRGG